MARTRTRPASLLTLAGRNLRRLRSDGAAPWVLWGVVVVAAFAVAAVPRFLNSVSDDALHTAVVEATPSNRNISVEQGMRIRSGDDDDVFAGVSDRGMDLRNTFLPAIEAIIDGQTYVVDSPSYAVAKLPGAEGDPPPRLFRFRHQLGIEVQITVVSGRLPVAVALANGPAVLFADEPTGELDTATSAEIFRVLRDVNEARGVTVVVVTHDPLVADHVNRTVAIRDGRTSTETLRATQIDEAGERTTVAEEFVILDRAGRLQLPEHYVDELHLARRVRLTLDEDHANVWPDHNRLVRRVGEDDEEEGE
jgi:hypothetical protein